MQGERRTSSLLECYAEPQLIFYKVQRYKVSLKNEETEAFYIY